MRWQLLAVGLFACGSGANGPGDGSVDASGAILQTDNGVGGLVSLVEFENALVGQSSSALVNLVNRGTSPTGPIDLTITGPHEDEFSVDQSSTTCAGTSLPGLGRCVVVLQFRPTAAGIRTASLMFGSSPGGSGAVELSSFVLLPAVHFSPTVLELPVMQMGNTVTRSVQLQNEGATSVALRDLQVVGSSFTQSSSTCTNALAAHSTCEIAFIATPIATGRQTGLVQVTADGATFAAPLRVRGAREVTITKLGSGTGRVTGGTIGIDCGATCRQLATSDVTLMAVPDPNSVFVGWSVPSCGSKQSCVVPLDAFPARITATFARATNANIALSFEGNGAGEARVRSVDGGVVANCYSNCTVPVAAGESYVVEASTWSQFSGFSANCPSTRQGTCEVVATAGTTTVTATFTKRAGERFTRFFPQLPTAVRLDSEGNVVVATNDRLIKFSPTGTTLWAMPFEAVQLDTGPRGSIFVVGTQGSFSGLFNLDAEGAVQWKVAVLSGYSGGDNLSTFAGALAAAPDGSVVSIGPQGVMSWNRKGTVAWSKALGFATVGGVGVKPDGTVVVGRRSGDADSPTVTGEQLAAADGSPLSSLGTIGQQWRGELAIDSAGEIAMHNAGPASIAFQWRSQNASTPADGPMVDTGICVVGAGPAVIVTNRKDNSGWSLVRIAASGAKSGSESSELLTKHGFGSLWLEDIACSRSGSTVVIGGNYSGFTSLAEATHSSIGYVQVLD